MLFALTWLYLGLLFLRPQEWVRSLADVPILLYLLLALLAAWVVTPDKGLRLPQAPLLVWLLLAIALSVGVGGAHWGGIPGALDRVIPSVLMFFVVGAAVRSTSQLRAVLLLFIVSASVMVLHGHWQLEQGVGWTGLKPLLGRITYAGIFSDPNDLGQMFVLSIAFCVYFFNTCGFLVKVTMLATAAWLGYGIYMTDSRGTMLAGLLVLALEGYRRFGTIVLATGALLAIPVLVASTRLGQLDAGEESAADRVEAWYAGIQMLKSHPVFGVGFGNFTEYHHLTAHNSLILPMAELGAFGFIPWFGLLWFTYRMVSWMQTVPAGGAARADRAGSREVESSRVLWVAAIGFALTAFFLSRSFSQLLYVLCGLIAGRFMFLSRTVEGAPAFALGKELPRVAFYAVCCMVFMWLVMKVLI